ncbi:SGNH/GDSL hydrolase family protein [Actinoplanes sichuanensis]|nr:SGNH/GDSL hydrolase family protein [Actinoplanes sichuanensis]
MGEQMNALLLPVVAAQAMWKRRRTVTIPAAEGPATGVVPGPDPQDPLSVVILGDSLAAGYGVHTHDEGFGGSLARDLTELTGRTVAWSAVGQYGATARRIRYRLLPRIPEQADIVVIVGGANDVLCGRQPHEWAEDLTAVVDESSRRAGQVMVAGIPPFEHLPCMPRTLGRHLARRAVALDEVAQQICDARPAVTWVPGKLLLPFVPAYFAQDGFHPSALGYRRWSAAVAGEIPT